ncbi:hypothetical protein [Micromonospora sp. CA-111912]
MFGSFDAAGGTALTRKPARQPVTDPGTPRLTTVPEPRPPGEIR